MRDGTKKAKVEVCFLQLTKVGGGEIKVGLKVVQALNLQGEFGHANGNAEGLMSG